VVSRLDRRGQSSWSVVLRGQSFLLVVVVTVNTTCRDMSHYMKQWEIMFETAHRHGWVRVSKFAQAHDLVSQKVARLFTVNTVVRISKTNVLRHVSKVGYRDGGS